MAFVSVGFGIWWLNDSLTRKRTVKLQRLQNKLIEKFLDKFHALSVIGVVLLVRQGQLTGAVWSPIYPHVLTSKYDTLSCSIKLVQIDLVNGYKKRMNAVHHSNRINCPIHCYEYH